MLRSRWVSMDMLACRTRSANSTRRPTGSSRGTLYVLRSRSVQLLIGEQYIGMVQDDGTMGAVDELEDDD